MRVGSLQRQRESSILPVIGGCLAVYAVCAIGFHSLIEPSLAKNSRRRPPFRDTRPRRLRPGPGDAASRRRELAGVDRRRGSASGAGSERRK